MCLKKNHDCYFYNMTGQERQDVHDQMKIFTIEVSDLLSLNVRKNRTNDQECRTQRHMQHWARSRNINILLLTTIILLFFKLVFTHLY
jgi:hypothetical protein